MTTERLAVSPAEAAELLGVSRPTVYLLLDTGIIRSVKCGTRRLISVASLEAYIDGDTRRDAC